MNKPIFKLVIPAFDFSHRIRNSICGPQKTSRLYHKNSLIYATQGNNYTKYIHKIQDQNSSQIHINSTADDAFEFDIQRTVPLDIFL